MNLTFATGCSGIGAPEVAWGDRLGWTGLWCSEIDPFASAVLKEHWPHIPNVGDFMNICKMLDNDELEAPDVFIAGTPCQAFSIAGLRKSLKDERGGLTLEYCKIANSMDEQRRRRGKQETIFVWENVLGVFSTKDNAFGCLLAGLTGDDSPCPPLKLGGRTVVSLLERGGRLHGVFLMHNTSEWHNGGSACLLSQQLAPDSVRQEDFLSAKKCRELLLRAEKKGHKLSPTLKAIFENQGNETNEISLPKQTFGIETHSADARLKETGDIVPTIQAHAGTGGGSIPLCYAIAENHIGRKLENGGNGNGFTKELAYTLNTVGKQGCVFRGVIRRITTVECARLQGFPDHHTEISWKKKSPQDCPKGLQYKAYGNAMCCNVIEWLGRVIEKEILNPTLNIIEQQIKQQVEQEEQLAFDF